MSDLIKHYQDNYTYSGKKDDGSNASGSRWTCRNKIHAIMEKTGKLISIIEVTYLCEMWAQDSGDSSCWNREKTVQKIENSSPEELKADIDRMRKKKGVLLNYLTQENRVVVSA